MRNEIKNIASRIRELRIAKRIKQSELDEKAGLPRSSISKIENGKREATAAELVRIAKSLGMTLDILVANEDAFVYQEEIKVIEALRELPFEDYQRIVGQIEAQVYFSAKDASIHLKRHLESLVNTLISLRQEDRRPRSKFKEKQRVRTDERRIG